MLQISTVRIAIFCVIKSCSCCKNQFMFNVVRNNFTAKFWEEFRCLEVEVFNRFFRAAEQLKLLASSCKEIIYQFVTLMYLQ